MLFSNRCGAFTKLGKFTKALSDSEECIRLNRTWAKGYSRKACVLYELGRFEEARAQYTLAHENEEDAAKKVQYLQSIIKNPK